MRRTRLLSLFSVLLAGSVVGGACGSSSPAGGTGGGGRGGAGGHAGASVGTGGGGTAGASGGTGGQSSGGRAGAGSGGAGTGGSGGQAGGAAGATGGQSGTGPGGSSGGGHSGGGGNGGQSGSGGAGQGGGGLGGHAGQGGAAGGGGAAGLGGAGGNGCKTMGQACTNADTCCLGLICAGTCSMGVSDRNMKRDFARVDGDEILQSLADLPVESWSYRSESSTVRHIGPMAQDFKAKFHVGEDDKHILQVDADGVALAAIKALNARVNRLEAENAVLRRRMANVRKDVSAR